jgi:hypothetical protein
MRGSRSARREIARQYVPLPFAGVRHLAAEDLPAVFARHHGLRPGNGRGEEPGELLDVHGLALAAFEEVCEAVEFGIG